MPNRYEISFQALVFFWWSTNDKFLSPSTVIFLVILDKSLLIPPLFLIKPKWIILVGKVITHCAFYKVHPSSSSVPHSPWKNTTSEFPEVIFRQTTNSFCDLFVKSLWHFTMIRLVPLNLNHNLNYLWCSSIHLPIGRTDGHVSVPQSPWKDATSEFPDVNFSLKN